MMVTRRRAAVEFLVFTLVGMAAAVIHVLVPELLDPRTGFLHFAFVSHKLLRWLAPFLLAVALFSSFPLALGGGLVWPLLLLGQLALYALALAAPVGGRGPLREASAAARHFVWMNAALAVGLWRFATGTQAPSWQRTERPARAA